MPKTFQPHQRQQWLEQFENGKSEKWIANNSKCDYRTVKKGIEEARRDRNATMAQIELVKEALTDHKNQLLAVIDEMRLMMVMPPDNLEVRIEGDEIAPIPLTRLKIVGVSGTLETDIPIEKGVAWELVHEHLKRDKIWKAYREWKDALLSHVQARINLKLVCSRLIKQQTGFEIREANPKNKTQGRINPETVQLFYEVTLRRSLKKHDGTNPEERIVASPDGYVRHGGGMVLAYTPNSAEECRKGLISAFALLQNSGESKEVSLSYDRLQTALDKTIRIIDEISLMRLLPGSCRLCRRLGIK